MVSFLYCFGQTSCKAGKSPAAAATSDNSLDFARFLKKVPLLANNPTLCRSDAKGRKQCNSNLFKKPVAAGVARKEPALTQSSVIYRQ